MRRLIRTLDASGLEYLLIGGQASIAYGAATFSEDVDLWIAPEQDNVGRLQAALAACGARFHKLTPALTPKHVLGGHGFHFVIPGRPLPVYLDVMGRPPRVGTYRHAAARAGRLRTPWGDVPTVAIEDLVELKKTRRLSDYEVIANLVRVRLADVARPGARLLAWAARNSFRAEDRRAWLARLGRPVAVETCRRQIAAEIAELQARDVEHWRSRVAELKALRARCALMPEGERVSL